MDDDAGIRDAIETVLTEYDYEVQTLARAEEVFKTIKAYQPDLILLDIMLGGLDGTVICSALKAMPETSHIPVILISAHYQFASSSYDKADGFIPKPFDISYLLEKIETQLAA